MLDRYLTKRANSPFWQLRVPVPSDVQERFGRKEVTKSLREKDKDKAARKAFAILTGLTDEWARLRFEAHDQTQTPALRRQPSEHSRQAAIGEAFEKINRGIRRRRIEDPSQKGAGLANGNRLQRKLVKAIDSGDLKPFEDRAEKYLRNKGYDVDRNSEWFPVFSSDLAEVVIEALSMNDRRDQGDLNDEPRSRVVREAIRVAKLKNISFDDLAHIYMIQWKADSSSAKKTNTEQQKKATFNLFSGFWRNQPIREVRMEDAAAFRDILKRLDPNWARSAASKKMDWESLCQRYGDHETGLSDATMNRHLATLQSLWAWAQRRGHCDGNNPFEGFHKKLRPGVNVQPYLAWESHELNQLLNPPPRRTDLYELILVGMFSGMRIDEIASLKWHQLRISKTRDGAILYFQIEDAKSPAGVRQVPIHSSLSWLTERKRGPDTQRIWNKFNEEGPGKKPGADAGREFSRLKASRGFSSRAKCFHSFRKNVTRIIEQSGVPENEWAQVLGHERGFTYSVYNPDGITLLRKKELIELISYPEVTIAEPYAGSARDD